MTYPEYMITPMRQDLARYGVEETRTPEEVDQLVRAENGTVLMIVNSVCGCAAGRARPAVGMALQHSVKPTKAGTVFAGGDVEAVSHLRHLLADFPPSSPSMALFKNGKPVFMVHRHEIEQRNPQQIAQILTDAFDHYCVD